MTTSEKFIEKNKDSIKELNDFINNNDVNLIIVCPEMAIALQYYPDSESIDSELIKYMDKRVIIDPYGSSSVKFVLKNNMIRFNTPCLCGIFNDEIHP